MKRTELKRKPHKDNPFSTLGPRKKPMPKQSAKQAKLNRDTKGIRRDPIDKFAVECDCGCGRLADDPHELVAGDGYRDKCMRNPRLLLYLRRDCHRRIQGMPYAKQIAIVARAMVRAVNRVRGCNVVSAEKVTMYLTKDE